MTPRVRILLLWIGLLAAGAAAPIQEGDLSAAAERWRGLDESRRRELEQRFEQFRELDEEQREALRERARALREERRALERALPNTERERLETLAPHERERILRRQQLEIARRRGHRLRESVPPELLERLRGAPPHDRPRVLHRWRDDLRRGLLEPSMRRRFGREGANGERLRSLLELPPEGQVEGFRRLLREEAHRRPSVLPPSVRADAELLERLRQATIPTVDELRERAESEGAESDLAASARARVLALLRESGAATERELERLQALPAPRLMIELHPRPTFHRPSGRHRGGDFREDRLRERFRDHVLDRRAGGRDGR